MIDDFNCSKDSTNDTIFANITSANFDLKSFESFLCEVSKLTNPDNPFVYDATTLKDLQEAYDPVNGVDFEKLYIDLDSFYSVGDPRISIGVVLSSVITEIFPSALLQIELNRSGGCQILDNYICDSDGVKIKKVQIVCPEDYKFESITSENIVSKTLEIIDTGLLSHAEKFSNFLKDKEKNGWTLSLHYYTNFYLFYARLQKENSVEYYKYYQDTKLDVSKLVGKIIQNRNDNLFDNSDHYEAMIKNVQNF
jgi:hypothetical protein